MEASKVKLTPNLSPENDTTLTFFDNCSLDSLEYSDEMIASSSCLWSCYLLLGTSYCWVTIKKTSLKKIIIIIKTALKHRNAHLNPSWWLCVLVVYLFFYKSSLLKELPVLLQHPLLRLQSLEMGKKWEEHELLEIIHIWRYAEKADFMWK